VCVERAERGVRWWRRELVVLPPLALLCLPSRFGSYAHTGSGPLRWRVGLSSVGNKPWGRVSLLSLMMMAVFRLIATTRRLARQRCVNPASCYRYHAAHPS